MWKWIIVSGIVLILASVLMAMRPKSYFVTAVTDLGELEVNDGRKITMARVVISPPGEEKHEAAIFMLKEMTRDVEIWFEPDVEGYKIWLGCRKMMWATDCKGGMLLNETLIKAGVAEPKK